MTIDIAKTRFVVLAWPDHRWPVETYHWIERLTRGVECRNDNRDSVKKQDVVCARNTAIRDSLQASQAFEWFVFIDRDVRPGPRTKQFLELETDVKACQVKMRSEAAWSEPTSFHEAIWCASREVLATVEPPWFEHTRSADGCDMIACLCQSFRRKVLDAGFSISHGGWAAHDLDGSWC